jgi:ketosteroid isomerase-like protein
LDKGISRISAEIAIRNLIAYVAQYADSAPDLDSYLNLFTDDAVWEFADSAKASADPRRDDLRLEGREAIRQDRERLRAVGFIGPGINTYHLNTTLAVRVLDDENAEATSYFMYIDGTQTPAVVEFVGTYTDTFVREADGWKLKHRIVTPNVLYAGFSQN